MENLGMLPVHEEVMSDKRSREFLYRDFYNKVQRSELTFMASIDEKQLKMVQKCFWQLKNTVYGNMFYECKKPKLNKLCI
ncbi:hypothetical protein ACFPA1_20575 [Neobacillus sp. GCM10023253]|uniref:hypothetical protein n=1 Tax=Neobacillus sp. GCM10023253 TaxID=3252644 RepID=UPI00360BC620